MKKLHWSLLKRFYRLRGRYGVYQRLGRRWLLDNRNWIDQQLLIGRPYEIAQLARCRELIHAHRLEAFYDIGANFGLYSVLLAVESSLKHIHAFEPLPRNLHQCCANLYLNGLDDRVALHRCALTDQAGEVTLYVDPESTGVATILTATERRRQEAYQTSISVPACTFDTLIPDRVHRALIKIDVEGAERRVLAGMQAFLRRNQVVLQIETTDATHDQVARFMRDAGYRALDAIGPDIYYANLP